MSFLEERGRLSRWVSRGGGDCALGIAPSSGFQGLLLTGDEEASSKKSCAFLDLRVERKPRDHLDGALT